MKYWLSLGVDGFRVDMANSLVKDPKFDSLDLRDNEGNIWLWNKLMSGVKKDYPDCVFIAEWINPSLSIPHCGFDIDFYAHDVSEFNDLIRNEPGTNLLPDLEKGNNYFASNHHGSFVNFEKRYLFDLKNIGDKGAIGLVSGSHDQIRAKEKLSYDDLKDYFVFLLLSKNVPFIYYGDEIGIPHNFNISKDGGFIRTGARTPMEWNNDINSGFSKASSIYLPASGETNVEKQENDPNSLLLTVRKLIEIKKNYRLFDVENDINFISDNDVLIFERTDGKDHIFVCINLSGENVEVNNIKELVYGEKFDSNLLKPNGFVIYK